MKQNIFLKRFQEQAINQLIETTKAFFLSQTQGQKVIFQSPTGSGKTVTFFCRLF